MAITSTFCLSLSSPAPPSKTTTMTTLTQSQTPPVLLNISSQREEKWRRQCLVGVACMVIGAAIQTGDLEEISGNTVAAAKDMSPFVVAVAETKPKVPRWSDKRRCPPWHANSLETIVPENLPRPSAKRRWEAVGNINNHTSKKAPPVVKVVTTVKSRGTNCFSM